MQWLFKEGRCRTKQYVFEVTGISLTLIHFKSFMYRSADKSLARPGRKQATETEDLEFHISYL
jgi:hypothetical protein